MNEISYERGNYLIAWQFSTSFCLEVVSHSSFAFNIHRLSCLLNHRARRDLLSLGCLWWLRVGYCCLRHLLCLRWRKRRRRLFYDHLDTGNRLLRYGRWGWRFIFFIYGTNLKVQGQIQNGSIKLLHSILTTEQTVT